jgi:hypothetical protein
MHHTSRRGSQAEFYFTFSDTKAFGLSIDNERRDALVSLTRRTRLVSSRLVSSRSLTLSHRLRITLGHDEIDAAQFSIGYPHFRAVENVVVALFGCRRFQGERVTARARLR